MAPIDLLAALAQHQAMPPSPGAPIQRGTGWALWSVFGCGFGLVALIFIAVWLWALIDCVQRRFEDPAEKIVWALVIILVTPFALGALLYLIIGRGRGTRE